MFWMSKWICNIQSRVWKEEIKNNWNEFGRNIVCPFLRNMLQFCAVNEWGRYLIFFSFFRESVYCGFVLLVWTEEWLQRRRGSSIESAANACEFMLCVEGVLSHEGKVNWLLLVFAVATVGWQSVVTRQGMELPKQKILYQFGFLSTISPVRCLCVCVCVWLCCGSDLYLCLVQWRFLNSQTEGQNNYITGRISVTQHL